MDNCSESSKTVSKEPIYANIPILYGHLSRDALVLTIIASIQDCTDATIQEEVGV